MNDFLYLFIIWTIYSSTIDKLPKLLMQLTEWACWGEMSWSYMPNNPSIHPLKEHISSKSKQKIGERQIWHNDFRWLFWEDRRPIDCADDVHRYIISARWKLIVPIVIGLNPIWDNTLRDPLIAELWYSLNPFRVYL